MRKKCALSFSWFLIVILTVAISSSGAFGAEKVTIRWLYPGGDQPVSRQTWQGHLERFEAKYPNIKVELLDVPWDLVHDRLVNMIMAGDGPDVIQIGARWLPEFVEMGAFMPLDKLVTQDKRNMYYPGLIKAMTYKGKLYAMPRAYSTQALIYRSDLIKTPPKTWDELVKVAKKVQEEHPGIYGFAIAGANHVSTLSQYFCYLFQAGGNVFDEKGNLILDSPRAIEALRFYRDLYTVHKVVPNPLEYHREQLPELFAAGRIAMFVSGPWGGRSVGRPPQNPKTPYAAALLPAGPEGIATELVSDCTGIYSKTKHPKEAWLLLDFITSEQEQIFRDKIGGLVPQGPKIAGLPEFQKDPYFSTFIKMAQYGVPQPQPLRWEPMQKIIVEMIQKVLLQKATPEQAVKEAAREIEEQGLVPASSKK